MIDETIPNSIQKSTAKSYSRTRKRRKRPPNSTEKSVVKVGNVNNNSIDEENDNSIEPTPMSHLFGALIRCDLVEQRHEDIEAFPEIKPLELKMRNRSTQSRQAMHKRTIVLLSALLCAAVGSLITGKLSWTLIVSLKSH